MAGEIPPPSVKEKITTIVQAFFSLPTLLIVIVLASFGIIYSLSRTQSANSGAEPGGISNIDFARGLITLLFAVGTIAIALILTIAAVFQSDAEAKERFDRGKQVLLSLIGIFGTIIGFYFGSATRTPPVEPAGKTAPIITDKSGVQKKDEVEKQKKDAIEDRPEKNKGAGS